MDKILENGTDYFQMSETIGILAFALSKVQFELKPAKLNRVNPFLKNKYADLGAVFDACREALSNNKVAVVQVPSTVDGNIALSTILMHESGEWIAGTIAVPYGGQTKGVTLIQTVGSAISYLKRYMLSSMVGVSTGDDLDGEEGRKSTVQKKQVVKKTKPITIPDYIPSDRKNAYTKAMKTLFDSKKDCTIQTISNQATILNIGYDKAVVAFETLSKYQFPDEFILELDAQVGIDSNKQTIFNWLLEQKLKEK